MVSSSTTPVNYIFIILLIGCILLAHGPLNFILPVGSYSLMHAYPLSQRNKFIHSHDTYVHLQFVFANAMLRQCLVQKTFIGGHTGLKKTCRVTSAIRQLVTIAVCRVNMRIIG